MQHIRSCGCRKRFAEANTTDLLHETHNYEAIESGFVRPERRARPCCDDRILFFATCAGLHFRICGLVATLGE